MNLDYILLLELALLLIVNPLKICYGSVPESEFLPFRESDGNSRFHFGDDAALNVPFTSPFKLFNKTYWGTYISGNGLLSFGAENPTSSTGSSCEVTAFSMVMPFWADANEEVDPDGSRLTYRETSDSVSIRQITNVIRTSFSQHRRINLTWLFVVTWRNSAAHGSSFHSTRNTFQVILATNGVHSFVLFYYNKISWSKGNAVAGFEIGSGTGRRYKIQGSCSSNIENIEDRSNIDQPGKWVFQVDQDVLDPSPWTSSPSNCEDGKLNLRIDHPVVSVMGNIPLLVRGLCLKENATVMCNFQDKGQLRQSQEIRAVLLPTVVVCPVPFLYSLGKMALHILVSYPDKNPTIYKTHLYVVKEPDFSDSPTISIKKFEETSLLSANWDPTLFSMKDIANAAVSNDSSNAPDDMPVNHCQILSGTVQIVILEYNGKKWKNLGPIIPPILNNGVHMSPVNISLLNQLIPNDGKLLIRTFAIEAKYSTNSGESLSKMFPSNIILGTANLTELVNANTNFSSICQSWYNNEQNTYFDVLPCPLTVDQARLDWRFALEKVETSQILNEGASVVYMQKVPSRKGASSVCAYDINDRLMTWKPGSGRVFRRSPNNWNYYWKYLLDDFLPYMYCCKWGNRDGLRSNDCSKYNEKRPIDYGTDYISPRPVRVVGDPHITTFDGISYTFNGAGEFWLIRYVDDTIPNSVASEFKMQVRMEPFQSNASVITAVVMEEVGTDYEVKVQVVLSSFQTKKGLSILLDGEPLNVHENAGEDENSPWNSEREFTLYHSGVVITLKSFSEALVTFSSGISFNFKAVVDGTSTEKALNIVGSAGANLKNKFEGLLGNFDGDPSNDLKLPNGTILNRDNMTMEDIHKDFGLKWIVRKSDTMFQYLPNQSYAHFNQPNFSPWFLPSEDINGTSILEDNFCEDSQDCLFDYLATGSSEIAKATMGASILFKEINDMSMKIVQQCEHINPPTKGYLEGSSYVMGSTIEVKCNENFTLNHNEFQYTCGYSNQSANGTTPKWLSPTGKRIPPTLRCISPQEVKTEVITQKPEKVPQKILNDRTTTIKIEPENEISTTTTTNTTIKAETKIEVTRKHEISTEVTPTIVSWDQITNHTEKLVEAEVTEKSSKDSTARLSSADSPSSVWVTLVFLVSLIIISIIAVVVIMEYPACKPVKCFVTNKYYRVRMNNDDNVESESIGMT